MRRLFLLPVLICLAAPSAAEEPAQADAVAAVQPTLEDRLKADPGDESLFNQYLMQNLVPVQQLMRTDAEAAQAKIDALRQFFDSLPTDGEAKQRLIERGRQACNFYEQQIKLARTTLEELQKKIREKADDPATLSLYQSKLMQEVGALIRTAPDQAEQRLAAAREHFEAAKAQATEDDAVKALDRVGTVLDSLREQLEVALLSLPEVEQRIRDNPNDARAIGMYRSKLMQQLLPLARSEAASADAQLKAAQEFLGSVRAKADDVAAKKAHEQLTGSLGSLERMIASQLLIGSDAMPLDVEAWVNGEPLAEADLKGKVVLLDFWAVWCGPCIATFPHLREWQEKYAEKGLVIIGLTRYYYYVWDETTNGAKRLVGEEKATPEQEQEMLRKFAESHQLHHRFAIQKDNAISEYYAVSGIPHVVVIDREGKVRLVRVGSGDQNAKDIEEMLVKLIGDGASP